MMEQHLRPHPKLSKSLLVVGRDFFISPSLLGEMFFKLIFPLKSAIVAVLYLPVSPGLALGVTSADSMEVVMRLVSSLIF